LYMRNRALESDNKVLRREGKMMEEVIERLWSENMELKSEVEALEEKKKKADCEELVRHVRRLDLEIRQKDVQIEEAEQQFNGLAKKYGWVRQSKMRLMAEIAEKDREILDLKEELSAPNEVAMSVGSKDVEWCIVEDATQHKDDGLVLCQKYSVEITDNQDKHDATMDPESSNEHSSEVDSSDIETLYEDSDYEEGDYEEYDLETGTPSPIEVDPPVKVT
jgi:chromosome segregation ATPase